MAEPTTKAKQLAYVRVEAPDLSKAETFLEEFGLQVAARTDDAIYFRGTDPKPPCYVLSQGNSGVTAIAFEADTASDLERMSAIDGASAIQTLDEPGGGQVVHLQDPQGMRVEIVCARSPLDQLTPAPAHAFNMDGQRTREGELPGVKSGPSHIRRIGHLVLESADPNSVYQWYSQHLGLQISDRVNTPDGGTQMIFSRLDRGQQFVDHHVVGFQFALDEGARVQHIAFEVGNFDDLMSGHDHLKAKRCKNVWGIGRHRLGGQIFDYWSSPWGVIHEHWTDTDLVNQDHEASERDVTALKDYWGPAPTLGFVVSRWNWKTIRNIARLVRARATAT